MLETLNPSGNMVYSTSHKLINFTVQPAFTIAGLIFAVAVSCYQNVLTIGSIISATANHSQRQQGWTYSKTFFISPLDKSTCFAPSFFFKNTLRCDTKALFPSATGIKLKGIWNLWQYRFGLQTDTSRRPDKGIHRMIEGHWRLDTSRTADKTEERKCRQNTGLWINCSREISELL